MEDLPDEIVTSILDYLDPLAKLRLARVNKRFWQIATDPFLHRHSVFRSESYLAENFITSYIKRYGSNLHGLGLSDFYWLKLPVISSIPMCCGNLRYLDLAGCVEIPVHMVFAIFKQNPKINHFGWTVPLDFIHNLKNLSLHQGQSALERIKVLSVLFEDVVSLKLALLVYPMIIYKDGFEPESLLFIHIIPGVISPRLKSLDVVCLDRAQYMVQPKLSCVVLKISIVLKELVDTSDLSSTQLHKQFLSTRELIASASISPHGGIIKGWIKHLLVQKSHTIKTLVVAAPPFLNFWISLLGNGLHMCDIKTLKVLDISFCQDVPVYWMSSVFHANSLRVVNVSHMDCVSGELLKVLAEGSPYLESLNLQGCHDCLQPIDGLKLLSKRCQKLRHLNLCRVHYHSHTSCNELLRVISGMKSLLSLGLAGCSVISHIIFECPEQQSEMFDALAYCQHLQKLTIAGMDVRKGLEFLVKIACSCSQLSFLSLAQLQGLEMSCLPTLTKALSYCWSLTQFRYGTKRPGLAVCLFPYDSNTRDLHDKLFNHAHEKAFPLVHLRNLSLFGSQVATGIR
ncbi:predicted protein [Nematostella vectensis]|uniref:F-box domain-containing protein n=1 Tax=Nematostella vectensis TaxID=45351 RepID=A7T1C4_NEMVE|nr:predicted protein [Nematostella vectensis]|eukprot:XP_001622348.1 predicted protein [Nematostella vectensis]